MTDEIYGLVHDAKKKKFSYIGPNIGDEDVISVWDGVSAFIRKQMDLMKGVCIGGLGTFTFSQKKIEVGGNKFLQIQRPVFVISDAFSMKHNLRIPKQHTSGQFPIVQLNYAAISLESPFDRDTVEACVKEVLLALDRSIAAGRSIEFVFTSIGRLSMREGKIKMRFYKDFLNSMDGTGNLVNSLKDRPGTVDSVMSDRPPTRPYSTNTMLLPRIIPAPMTGNSPQMPTIAEGEIEGEYPHETEPVTDRERIAEENEERGVTMFDQKHDELMNINMQPDIDQTDDICVPFAEQRPMDDVSPPPPISNSRMNNRVAVPIPRAVGVSFNDELLHSELHTPRLYSRAGSITSGFNKPLSSPQFNKHPLSPFSSNHFKPSPTAEDARPRSQGSINFDKIWKMSPFEKFSPSPTENGMQHTGLPVAGFEEFALSPAGQNKHVGFPAEPELPQETMSARASVCGHANSGQELCYLCHQREKRNVPVFLAEERRAHEQKEDQLLQQFQSIVDADTIMKEQESDMEKKRESQKMAAFNLGVAEAVHTKKHARDPFHMSYIFQQRPRTPPKYVKQDRYFQQLEVQVTGKQETEKQQKTDEEFLGRLEQVQLAEELAAQRDQYMRNKMDQQNMYRRALSAQLKFKSLPLPARVSDSGEPIFGRDDMANEKLAMQQRRARDISQQQVATVEQQKRGNLLRRLNEQRDEEEVLKRTKKELQDDRARKYAMQLQYRQKLQADWARATAVKRAGEASERARVLTPGRLLHEQCDQYKRCNQCKRRPDNCGETNLWKESRYIAGSRLIV